VDVASRKRAAVIILWSDYVSPYAFVAKAAAYALEAAYEVELLWRPYTLDVASFMGPVAERDPHHWRRVRYSYMDARRFANKQGLTLKGPKKVYYARPANAGMLYAQKHGVFRVLGRRPHRPVARAARREGCEAPPRTGLGPVEGAVDALVQRLHRAALLVDTLLHQPLGATEGVRHRKLRVGEAIVGLRRVIDVDVDTARQGEVDVGAVETAGAMMLVGDPDHDVTGGQPAMDMFQRLDMLLDHAAERLAGLAALKADFELCFHWTLPRSESERWPVRQVAD
jgi:hypothetical protein